MRNSRINRALLASAVLGVCAMATNAEQIYAVSANGATLHSFDSATPATINTIGSLSGLVAGHTVRGIDFRPFNGQLYAISSDSTGGTAQMYTVNLATAALSLQGASFALTGNTSTGISMDFNPAADRLRIISTDTIENNFRWNPTNNTFVQADGDLTYDAGDPNAGSVNPSITALAYDRNDNNPSTPTTVFTYDFTNDDIGTIGNTNGVISPNTGTMFTVSNPSSGFVLGATMGFDVSGVTGTAYVSADVFLSNPANDNLYTVNLTTGALTLVGSTGTPLLDISAVVPEPASMSLLALGAAGFLRRRR